MVPSPPAHSGAPDAIGPVDELGPDEVAPAEPGGAPILAPPSDVPYDDGQDELPEGDEFSSGADVFGDTIPVLPQ